MLFLRTFKNVKVTPVPIDGLTSPLLWSPANMMKEFYLEKPVERNPEEENVSEELEEWEESVDHPVDQPGCVIVLLCALHCLEPENKQKNQ